MAEISPHKDEVEAMVAVLTDDTFEGPEDMAKALLKTAYGCFRRRDWFAFGVLFNGRPAQVYGLEPTELAAWKSAGDLSYRDKAIWPILSYDRFLESREEAIEAAEFVPNPTCVKCGHERWAHMFVNAKGNRVYPKASKAIPKCSTVCDCDGFLSESDEQRIAAHEEQTARRRARQEEAA